MDSLIGKRCTKFAGGSVKTLKPPDGRYENRTCKGDRDAKGRSDGIYSSLAEAREGHNADVKTFNEVPLAA